MRLATRIFGVAIVTMAAWLVSGTPAEARGVPLAKVLGIDLDADSDIDIVIGRPGGPIPGNVDVGVDVGVGVEVDVDAASGGVGAPAFGNCPKPVAVCCCPVVVCKPNPCIKNDAGHGRPGCDPGAGVNIVININIEITIIININASPSAFAAA